MKTTNQVLTDIAILIKTTPIDALSGDVYKKTRPTNSTLEDCIVSLIPGTSAKFIQDGALYVKIFFPDINMNDTWYEDFANGANKETLLFNLSELLLKNPTYSFDVVSREIYIEKVEEIRQHFAILKMNFKLLM